MSDKEKDIPPAGLLLGHVWQAKDAWSELMALRMKSRIRYKLFKYYKGVADDLTVIGGKHNEIVGRIGKPDKDGRVSVRSGTAEHAEYTREFSEFLNQGSDLKRAPFDLDALDDGIDVDGNVFAPHHYAVLEPFFNQKGVEEETG